MSRPLPSTSQGAETVIAKRRGPIPRDAFEATLDIMRSSIGASPYYDDESRRIALHLLETVETGTLNLAWLQPRAHLIKEPQE